MRLDLSIAAVLGAIILCFVFAGLGITDTARASTDFGNYNSTLITSSVASSTSSSRLQNQGTLGSVVILATSTAALRFYDGTGTASSTAELLFTIPAGTAVGTYTFDIGVDRGLIVDVPAAHNGQTVVTHRI